MENLKDISNVDTDVTVQSSNTPPAENVIPVEVQRNITKLPLDDRRGLSMTILEKYHCGYDLKTRRIFIPTVLPDDNLSYVAVLTKSARKELDAKGTEYKKVKAGNGTRGIFNLNNISADSPVFITEGEIDALSIIEAGYENVIAVGGQSVGNLIDWLNKNPAKFQFLVLFDNDDSGKKAAPKAIKNLIENGYPAVSNFLAVSADKVDANDLLLKNRIEQILAEAKLEFEKPAAQVTEVIKPPTKKKSKRKKISSCFEYYITIDEMKGMLEKINVESLTYDEWALTVGGGLVNWGTIIDDLDIAFSLFNQFSAQDTRPKKYSESGCMSQWDNLVKGESKEKKRSVQHLIDLAKQYGYVVPDPIPDSIAKVLSKGTDPDDDLARAVKVFAFADNTLRYVADADCWATYDGVKWNFTPKSNAPAVYPYVYRMVQAIRQSLKNGRAYRDFDDFFNKKKIDAAISLIKSLPDAIAYIKDFDADDTSFLLNVRNGTVNLKTGELLPHSPEHYITHCADVDYQPNAQSDVVDNFLQEILPDADTRSAILRYLGYALTGNVTEEATMFARGEGKNGKSTLTKTLQAILGDYAGSINSDVLLSAFHQKDAESANPAVANLRGKRLVIGSDLKGGCKLDDSTIKRLCSRDKITARKLHQNPIEFNPTHKLWISGQHYPELKNVDDNGVNRRLVMVEFTQTFDGDNCDPDLDEKLSQDENKSALLNILVDEAKSWYSAISSGAFTGLIFSDAMTRTKTEYLFNQDWFISAFDELFDKTDNPLDKMLLSTFRNILINRCAEAKLLSSSQLNRVIDNGLKKLGIEKKFSHGKRYVYGVKEIVDFPEYN